MCFTHHKFSLKLGFSVVLFCNAVIIIDMVIDEQKHWRHSLHLLHEVWEKMDLDKDATDPSVAIGFN